MLKKILLPIFLVLFFITNSNAQFVTGRIELPFKLSISQDNEIIKVNFKLNYDSYIYKDSISIEGVNNYSIKYPYSIHKLDKFTNKYKDLYAENFSLSIKLKDLKIKNNEINLSVKYQGCTSKVCFLPQIEKLKISFKK